MHVTCSCGKILRIRDDGLAKRVRCPACKSIFTVDPADQLKNEAAIQEGHPRHFAPDEGIDDGPSHSWRDEDDISFKSSALVWIFGIAAAAVLLIGAGAAAFVLLLRALAADEGAIVAQPMPVRPVVPPKLIVIEEADLAPRGKEPKQVKFAAAPARLADVNWVRTLAYAPDGKHLATVQNFSNGLAHYVLQVWEVPSGKQRFKLHEGNDNVDLIA